MQIYKVIPAGFAANGYILTEDGLTAVAIDPAQPRFAEEVENRGLRVKYVLLTHGHFDHIGGCHALQKLGAKIGCLKGEEDLVLHHNLGFEPIPEFKIDFTFEDEEELLFCAMMFRVLATPGHTAGSACFISDRHLFTGDTMFAGGVGRWDLPTGNEEDLRRSLAKLRALHGNYRIHPGHDWDTNLDDERDNDIPNLPVV